jgi:GT2 family glycosyltransferase
MPKKDITCASLSICLVNWNAGRQLLNCLQSITKCVTNNFILDKVVVVDNCSSDNSIMLVESERLNLPLVIIKNEDNFGFAKACNMAAKITSSDYYLFLNPDTILFEKSLDVPLEFMQQSDNGSIGILGIRLVDKNDNLVQSCSYFPSFTRLFNDSVGLSQIFSKLFPSCWVSVRQHLTSCYVDQVMGAFFLVRGTVYRSLSGFDEDFFVYYEEVDFSYRAHKNGYKSYYLTNVNAFHEGGGCSKKVLAKRLFYSMRSRVIYIKKHFGFIQRCFLLCTIFCLEPFARIGYSIARLQFHEVTNTIKAYWYLIGFHFKYIK